MSKMSSEPGVPLRWPAAWTKESAAELLAGTPVTCVVDPPSAITAAVRARGVKTLTKDEAASAAVLLPDPVWPSVKMARRGEGADSGPTGAPWVDANGWSIQLTRGLHPDKPVWVDIAPPADHVVTDADYELAVAEPAAYGARWVITLDDKFANGLAADDAAAKQRWSRMMQAARFFEAHPEWGEFEVRANLAVISDFAGPNEFLGREFLNLAARQNLPFRVSPKQLPLRLDETALYLDEQPPAGEVGAKLLAFVKGGGLLIAPKSDVLTSWGGAPATTPIPGYETRTIGKGRLIVPKAPWEDPWMVAAEVRILVGRRTDVVRLFNGGILGVYYTRSKDGTRGLVQLLNYTRRSSPEIATIAPADNYATARALPLNGAPKTLEIVKRGERFGEIALPPTAVYSAIELGR